MQIQPKSIRHPGLDPKDPVIPGLTLDDRQGYPPKVGALREAFAVFLGQALVEMQ
jgi:hypothetical protein